MGSRPSSWDAEPHSQVSLSDHSRIRKSDIAVENQMSEYFYLLMSLPAWLVALVFTMGALYMALHLVNTGPLDVQALESIADPNIRSSRSRDHDVADVDLTEVSRRLYL